MQILNQIFAETLALSLVLVLPANVPATLAMFALQDFQFVWNAITPSFAKVA